MKKKYPYSKLHVKREKDILSIWYYYVLTIKDVLMTVFRDTLGTIVLIITIIRDEAVSYNSSSRFQEKHQSNLSLIAGLKYY